MTDETEPMAKWDAAAQLKRLRESRGPIPKEMTERAKSQKRAQTAVLKTIEAEAKTAPEIATETGMDAQEVFWWIAALRKYNKVSDEGKRGDYMTYLAKREQR
jgi:predicted Rossmann fold nucleotide-binding protein DprA/Smf involved in DNA uptake